PQNVSTLFPAGYTVRSSSSFSQQDNAVVETTNVQYQLPPQIYTQIHYSLVNSINLTATQSGMSGQGTLTISSGLPVQTLSLVYSTSPTKIEANATAQIYFNQNFGTTPFANQTIFQTTWSKTFDNSTWRDTIRAQIQNQFFQCVMRLQPVGTITPSEQFLNSTTITVSKISMTSDLDLNAGTSSTTLSGLFIAPPTVGTNTNFTIPGLFQTLGSVPFP